MGRPTSTTPTISVIVPTRNRPGLLAGCLEALARQELEGAFEVIVVDDGGSRPLAAVAEAFDERLQLTLIAQAWTGPAGARNRGARHARGRLLAFTDDDCRPTPGWLAALERRLARAPGALIGGRTINTAPGLLPATSQLVLDAAYAYHNPQANRSRFIASGNLAAPAERFARWGGFDPSFTTSEDRELCHRWRRRGGTIVYAADAVVHHAHALGLRGFLDQHYRYGRGAYRYHVRRARARQRGLRLEPPSFYWHLLRYPTRDNPAPRAATLTGLLALSQLASLCGFARELVRARGR